MFLSYNVTHWLHVQTSMEAHLHHPGGTWGTWKTGVNISSDFCFCHKLQSSLSLTQESKFTAIKQITGYLINFEIGFNSRPFPDSDIYFLQHQLLLLLHYFQIWPPILNSTLIAGIHVLCACFPNYFFFLNSAPSTYIVPVAGKYQMPTLYPADTLYLDWHYSF